MREAIGDDPELYVDANGALSRQEALRWAQIYAEEFGVSYFEEPVSSEDSISPGFYELEREAIFKRAWLQVGRVEQLPRHGSFFTKEIPAADTSIVIVRVVWSRPVTLPVVSSTWKPKLERPAPLASAAP